MKERTNNTNLDIILFTYSRGVGKSLFHCRRPKSTQVMSVCLHHIKAIIRNQIFCTNFAFLCGKESDKKMNLPNNEFPTSIHRKHDDENFSSIHQCVRKLQLRACNLFSLYLLYKACRIVSGFHRSSHIYITVSYTKSWFRSACRQKLQHKVQLC